MTGLDIPQCNQSALEHIKKGLLMVDELTAKEHSVNSNHNKILLAATYFLLGEKPFSNQIKLTNYMDDWKCEVTQSTLQQITVNLSPYSDNTSALLQLKQLVEQNPALVYRFKNQITDLAVLSKDNEVTNDCLSILFSLVEHDPVENVQLFLRTLEQLLKDPLKGHVLSKHLSDLCIWMPNEGLDLVYKLGEKMVLSADNDLNHDTSVIEDILLKMSLDNIDTVCIEHATSALISSGSVVVKPNAQNNSNSNTNVNPTNAKSTEIPA